MHSEVYRWPDEWSETGQVALNRSMEDDLEQQHNSFSSSDEENQHDIAYIAD